MYNEYEVGERLTKLREEKGFSQEGLAEKIGCSAITISRWENGHTHMKDTDIYSICSVLMVSSDELLGLSSKNVIYEDMLAGLSEEQKNIVFTTVKAMVGAMQN